ncbi:MAG: SURF1 family protein [Caulobacteraceae bacterium]
MRRFPLGLTLAAMLGLAALVGLGVWQLHRLAWKTDLLARIAALRHAPARPLAQVLAMAARGHDVGYLRVETACGPGRSPGPAIYRYALRPGGVGWRLMGYCPLAGGPWSGIVLDRGLVNRFTGQMAPAAASYPAPRQVSGILRRPGVRGFLDVAPRRAADGSLVLQSIDTQALRLIAGGVSVAPYYLAVESESPAPPGVTPAALPGDIPNNHFVYALTWFGLAGVLFWMWAAVVFRRMRRP